jgi:hypothetical protein
MKKIIIITAFFSAQLVSHACPVCERNKQNALQNLTHGSNPDSTWDYVIVFAMIIIAIATLFYSIKWLIKPNEKNADHIKYSLLN